MKKLLYAMIIFSMVGCTTHTEMGRCVGFMDEKKPGLTYDLSYWNLFVGLVFAETIIVPVVVAAKHLKCPTEKTGE